jgi:hypothetical protein
MSYKVSFDEWGPFRAYLDKRAEWDSDEPEPPPAGTVLFVLVENYTTESTFNDPSPQIRVHSWHLSFGEFEAAKASAVSPADDDYFDKHVSWGIEVARLQAYTE